MSPRTLLSLPAAVKSDIWQHLFADPKGKEGAAFAFARSEVGPSGVMFDYLEWYPVKPEGYSFRSNAHFELTDEVQAAVIKRAHVLGASLIELHSHTGRWPAQFSFSDLAGLREFVPHARWRLKGRPYLAIVVARDGFDGFAWDGDSETPSLLGGITVGDVLHLPTMLSRWGPIDTADLGVDE